VRRKDQKLCVALSRGSRKRGPGRNGSRRHSAARIGLLLAFSLFLGCAAYGQSVSYTESQLKVLFIHNFAKYTVWPQEALSETNNVFTLGIVGNNLPDEALRLIRDKTIKNRDLRIKKFGSVKEALSQQRELELCQVVFVSASEGNDLSELFKLLKKASVLTIGEADGFLDRGGIINFVVAKNKVNFEINSAAAQRANLKLDTQLLKLAKLVKDKE
jgi:YfiR/HmsC-like